MYIYRFQNEKKIVIFVGNKRKQPMEISKFTFCGHTKHFQSMWSERDTKEILSTQLVEICIELRLNRIVGTQCTYALLWFWETMSMSVNTPTHDHILSNQIV